MEIVLYLFIGGILVVQGLVYVIHFISLFFPPKRYDSLLATLITSCLSLLVLLFLALLFGVAGVHKNARPSIVELLPGVFPSPTIWPNELIRTPKLPLIPPERSPISFIEPVLPLDVVGVQR